MDARTNAIEQKVENSSEILPVFSNVTVTYPHYDIERIQEQRHKQFQYVCDKYKDEIPPNVSPGNILLNSSVLCKVQKIRDFEVRKTHGFFYNGCLWENSLESQVNK